MSRGVLTIMGSGETSPTMVTPHQHLLKRYGSDVRAVVLDSPAGFQENVGELTEKAISFFAESVGVDVARVSFRSAAEATDLPVEHAEAMQRLRSADWVFAGPGSPSYALRTWAGSAVPEALRGVVDKGGTVIMASAASLTLGAFTVPVYEVYKVGEDPRWLEGLDLLGHATGWRAAVIPHFDNTDGGTTHDTRFCYLGLTRLEAMERELPDDAFILGIDEHTGLVLDLDDQTASIVGRGVVTLRVRGRQRTLSAGTSEPLATIDAWLTEALRDGGASEPLAPRATEPTVVTDSTPLPDDLAAALAVVIERDRHASSDDERAAVRAALAELASRSGPAVDERSLVAPFVEALLSLRAAARADKRWADADAARDALVACGVEVRDTADGVEWDLRH